MKMLEDLAEVVRLMDAGGTVDVSRYADGTSEITGPDSAIAAIGAATRYIRTHHATIRDMAAENAALRDSLAKHVDRLCELTERLEAAERDAAGEREEYWEVWQDDMPVAASSDYEDAQHYLMMYAQEGPAKLVRVVTYRKAIDQTMQETGR